MSVLKQPSVDDLLKKMWSIDTIDYYVAIKKSKIMTFAVTRLDLVIITLSGQIQIQKDNYITSVRHGIYK